MGIFRELAHLVEQLDQKRFRALITPGNTDAVKAFCDGLMSHQSPASSRTVESDRADDADVMKKLIPFSKRIGEDRFRVLVNSGNTGAVKAFCDELVMASLPMKMTVEGRTYDILSFHCEGERTVADAVMLQRSRELNACLGEDDAEYILAHRARIPVALQSEVFFIFPMYQRKHPVDDRGDVEGSEDTGTLLMIGPGIKNFPEIFTLSYNRDYDPIYHKGEGRWEPHWYRMNGFAWRRHARLLRRVCDNPTNL
ncbi:MAG: hypothetical protein V1848_01140 [Candidatus Magasanikbacteria bacterium]